MKSELKAVFAAFVCLALALPMAIAQQAPDEGNDVTTQQGDGQYGNESHWNGTPYGQGWIESVRERWEEGRQERIEKRDQLMDQIREQIQEKLQEHLHLGNYTCSNGTTMGGFVTFDVENGTIFDYALRYLQDETGTVLFETISVEGFNSSSEQDIRGSVARFEIGSVEIASHDNPTGMLMIRSEGESKVIITLGSSLEIEEVSPHRITLNSSFYGSLIMTNAEYTLENLTLTVVLEDEGRIVFIARPQSEGLQEYIEQGIENGTVCAEIRVAKGRPVEAEDFADAETDITYGNGPIQLKVSSTEQAGKIVVVIVDNETIEQSKLNVMYDGSEIQPVQSWAELQIALQSGGTANGTARYMIRTCYGGYQICVAVPHFSEHTITIEEAAETAEPVETFIPFVSAGAVAFALAAAAAAIGIMKRR